MSELINNREYRQEKLKELIKKLHEGASVDEVREEFSRITDGIAPSEITEMEQSLVNEGMPVKEIQRLCDVHASVFKGSIEDIHSDVAFPEEDNLTLEIFKRENRAIEDLIDTEITEALDLFTADQGYANKTLLIEALTRLQSIDAHYSRKENLIFPYMENHEVTAPPQVMWGVDDEIRDKIKAVLINIDEDESIDSKIKEDIDELTSQIKEMIFKEEEIMFPMLMDLLSETEWDNIEDSINEFGFTLIKGLNKRKKIKEEKTKSQNLGSDIPFDAGSLSPEEINAILNTVPVDMTFVGADNRVKYFTQGKERVFERPLTIIGREIKFCHPPKSVHIVEEIVADLRSGKKDHEDFWIKLGEAFVYIRYFAVRNNEGKFLGVLEVTQNIKHITKLEGEKRLMS